MCSLCLQIQRALVIAIPVCQCRRSTNGLRVQAVAPNGGKHEAAGIGLSGGGKCSGRTNSNKAHPRPPLEHVNRKNGSISGTADDATTTTAFNIEAQREPREEATKQASASPTTVAAPLNELTMIIAANERQGGAKTESEYDFDHDTFDQHNIALVVSDSVKQGPKATVPTLEGSPRQYFPRQPVAGTSPAELTAGVTTASTITPETDSTVAATVGSQTTGENFVEDGASLLPGKRWPVMLDARWAEVEFVLCRAVESEESLRYTAGAASAGLIFLEKLEKKAQVTLCSSYEREKKWPPREDGASNRYSLEDFLVISPLFVPGAISIISDLLFT